MFMLFAVRCQWYLDTKKVEEELSTVYESQSTFLLISLGFNKYSK